MAYQFTTRAYADASVTSAKVGTDLVNGNISASAAIAVSKLAALTASKAVVTDGSGVLSTSATTATELSYLSGVSSGIQAQLNALNSGIYRRKTVIALVDPTAAPPTEVSGDRYILGFNVGSVHADWDGLSKGQIATFGGTVWTGETPAEGWKVYADTPNSDYIYVDDGTPAWQPVAVSSFALTDGKIWIGDASNVAVERTISGDITIDNLGVAAIASGVIVNADINSSAAIALSKLAAGSPAQIIVGAVTTGIPTYVTMSGDVTIDNVGATTIGASKVTNSMLAGSIADSKLSQLTTANKVAGSAVQLNAAGALQDSTGLQVKVDAATVKINGSNQLESLKPYVENFTLAGGDITNQYIDLAKNAYSGSVFVTIQGLPAPIIGTHLTLSVPGSVTRVTFAAELATAGAAALVAGDVLQVHYTALA